MGNSKRKFLSKYFSPARTAKKIKEINNFQQEPNETLYQAWERFKELLLRCPQHYLTDMQEVILFYKGLDVPTRQILNFKGAIPSMKVADAKKVIQDMAEYSQRWHNETSTRTRIMENMDAYRDEGMGDVIVGRPFCREIFVKASDGMITITMPQSPEAAPQSLKQAPLSPDYVPGYVPDFDPLEDDQEEDPEEDPTDYLADGGDDDDKEDESYEDNDDEEEDETFEEDEDDEEEHLALADSTALAAIDFVPSAEKTEPFDTDESAATPPPPKPPQTIVLLSMTRLCRARISIRPHTPPLPSIETLIVDDIPEVDMSSRKRLCLTALAFSFEVKESSTTAVSRQTGHTLARKVDYIFIDTLDASIRASEAWSRSEDRSTTLEALIMAQ
nr:hypothetical protein [Tanacetum cinerariifolium]